MAYEAIIKATGEKITVYKLRNGNYYDRLAMGENEKPFAQKANKKEFAPEELQIGKEVEIK